MRRTVAVGVGGLLALASSLGGCSEADMERRAREAAEEMQASIPNVHARAKEQQATPADIKAAQQALTAVHEYMGEIHGELDAVTINAIQAFQRSHHLEDDGVLTAETRRLLKEVASAGKTPQNK